MAFDVLIRRSADGLVRCWPVEDLTWPPPEDEDPEGIAFIWTDGNYGCDCNRALFFARAANDPDEDRECGDSAFKIRVRSRDGKILYDEWPEGSSTAEALN